MDMVTDDLMFAAFCPPGYCCTKSLGCNYLHGMRSLCANGRNLSAPLCGKCDDGLSELFGSTNCSKCDEHNYFLLFAIIILIIIPFTIYIAYFESKPNLNNDDDNNNNQDKTM
eukprot:463754_1